MKKIFYLFSLVVLISISSCENQDWSFPDYGTTTVYFAYQYPVRTLVLGNDEGTESFPPVLTENAYSLCRIQSVSDHGIA